MIKSNLSRDEEIVRKAEEMTRARISVEDDNQRRIQELEQKAGVNKLEQAKQTIKAFEALDRRNSKVVRTQQDAIARLKGVNPNLGPQGNLSKFNFRPPPPIVRRAPQPVAAPPPRQAALFQNNIHEGPKNISAESTERVVAPPFAPVSEIPPFNGPITTTIRSYSPPSERPGPSEALPSGAVMMVHLWTGESITDFFDLVTGIGTGRWDGWALCDGLNDGPNMQGYFPVCADPDNYDYDVQGNGTNFNGQTGFTYHSLKHSHALSFDPAPHLVGSSGDGVTAGGTEVYAWDAADYGAGIGIHDEIGCIVWSGFSDGDHQIPETVTDLDNPNADFILDNRPKNYVIHFAVKL